MLLESYSWPGNVRELKNIVERAVLLNSGAVIGTEHLPMEKLSRPAPPPPPGTPPPLLDAYKLAAPTPRQQVDAGRVDVPSPARAARGATNAAERERIIAALNACAGNQSRAAKLLGIPRRTFLTKLDGYGIPRPKKGLPDNDPADF
jgi:two-component system, NtrC family, response regulator AtoC